MGFFLLILFFIIIPIVIGINGIFLVPDDKVVLMTCFGTRPSKDGGSQHIFGSGFLTPGIHWFLLLGIIHKSIQGLLAVPFEVGLFRHDADLVGDVAEIELQDMNIKLRVNIILQISDNPEGDVFTSSAAFWRAHYNSVQKDFIQQGEIVTNPYIKSIFLDKFYDVDPSRQKLMLVQNPNLDKNSLEFTGIKNITPEKLLKELGLRKPNPGEGKFLLLDSTAPNKNIGQEILKTLNESGLKIINVLIKDIKLRPDVLEARAKRSILVAEQNALIDSEYVRTDLIEIENVNRMKATYGVMKAANLQKQFEVKGKKIEIVGFIEMINQASITSNGLISETTLFEILVRYPALKELLGSNAKLIFQGGGDPNDISKKILSTIDVSKEF